MCTVYWWNGREDYFRGATLRECEKIKFYYFFPHSNESSSKNGCAPTLTQHCRHQM